MQNNRILHGLNNSMSFNDSFTSKTIKNKVSCGGNCYICKASWFSTLLLFEVEPCGKVGCRDCVDAFALCTTCLDKNVGNTPIIKKKMVLKDGVAFIRLAKHSVA